MNTALFSRRRVLLLAAAGLPLVLAACKKPPKPLAFRGTDITGHDVGQDLDMQDASGARRRLADYRGQVLVVFFGYTHCPDVCPTSMARAAQAMRLLGKQADGVRVVMITVDPARDTAEVVQHYAQLFNPQFIGLSGSDAQLKKTASSFKVHYEKAPGTSPENYAMDHTAAFYLLDREGRARDVLSPNATAEDMAHDIGLLLGA